MIVPLGSHAFRLSGRLAQLIAHSGAVVLLQQSEMNYHFSMRLTPWVHYVPLTYSAADLIEKVDWLIKNDKLAHQIALNAKNFGASYLRMEDYYCYVADGLKTFSTIQNHSDITKGFNPKLMF